MGFRAAPPVPETIFVLNIFLFVLAYCAVKVLSKVLDKQFPWEAARDLREELVNVNEENLTSRMRQHLRSYWYQAKVVKFFMIFSVLQAFLITHSLTDKCRWSQVALSLAEHYKTVELRSRPHIIPNLEYENFIGIISYLMIVNGAAGYIIHKLHSEYRRRQLQEDFGRFRYSIILFTGLWIILTYRVIQHCAFSEEAFMKLFEAKADVKMYG